MNIEVFFEKFEQLAETPGAVERLRELVLQLAIRGKLTIQFSGESVRSQLERIRKSESDGHQQDLLNLDESPYSLNLDESPFSIPGTWGWVRLGDAMTLVNGRAFKQEEWSTEGTPIIRIQNLNNESAPFNRCSIEVDAKVHVNTGDFLISWSGTPGTSFGAFIWNRGFAYLNQHIFRCELVEGVFEKEFLRLAVNGRLDEMISQAQGAVGLRHITKGRLENILLALPPLPEQKRIVTKVDQLTALVDRLGSQLAASRAAAESLMSAFTSELLSSKD